MKSTVTPTLPTNWSSYALKLMDMDEVEGRFFVRVPCDYDRIFDIVERKKALFHPSNDKDVVMFAFQGFSLGIQLSEIQQLVNQFQQIVG